MINILKNAGRYEEVVNILKNIICDNNLTGTYPVDAFIDLDNTTRWRIDSKLIKEEATAFLQLLENGCNIAEPDEYFNLNQYIMSKSNMLLHNYAISISHRNNPEDNINMENIRIWLCLGNLLDNLNDTDKYIPDGWKNKTAEINVGDTVKVLGLTNCGGLEKELIPIGTICKVINIESDEEGVVAELVALDKPNDELGYWYDIKDLEKGHLEWIKD